jgi:hypothetical protein
MKCPLGSVIVKWPRNRVVVWEEQTAVGGGRAGDYE